MVSIIMYGLGQILVIFYCSQVNKIVYKKINMLLHDLSWIPIIPQSFTPVSDLVNPRRACAARVTVLGLCVCVCVCVSVKSHLTSGMSNRAINVHSYLMAYERLKICGDLPETTAFKSYAAKHERKSQYANFLAYPWSAFSTRRTAKRQRLPRDCRRHSALPKTMPTVNVYTIGCRLWVATGDVI